MLAAPREFQILHRNDGLHLKVIAKPVGAFF